VFDRVFAFARVVATTVAERTRTVMANLSGPGGGDPAHPDESASEFALSQEAYSALGLVVRPRAPGLLEGGAPAHAEALCVRLGDGLVPIGYRDLRLHAAYPAPKEGCVALVGYGGGFVSIEDTASNSGDRKASVVVLYAPYEFGGAAAGKAHVVTLDTTAGNESIAIVHGDGLAITMHDGKIVLKNAAGDAFIELGPDGIILNGNVTVTGGMVVGAAVPGAAAAAEPALTASLRPSAFLKVL